jgi:hypothetical protein
MHILSTTGRKKVWWLTTVLRLGNLEVLQVKDAAKKVIR